MKKEQLNKQQMQLLRDFISTTEASEKQALVYLNNMKWNIQNSINKFFDDGAMPEREEVKSSPKLEQLYISLSNVSKKNPNVRYMDEDQFSLFNKKYLHIEDDNVVLGHLLLNIMEVETSGHIQRHHFLKMFAYLGATSPQDLHKHINRLENQLKKDKNLYYQMYLKLYQFYLIGNKEMSLDYDIVEELWKVYLKPIMPLYQTFVSYLEQLGKRPHKVHHDLWKMVYEFATSIKDVSSIQQSDGWPVFLDDFVEYCRGK